MPQWFKDYLKALSKEQKEELINCMDNLDYDEFYDDINEVLGA